MSRVQRETTREEVQHERSATHKKVQHENGTTRKKCNIKKFNMKKV